MKLLQKIVKENKTIYKICGINFSLKRGKRLFSPKVWSLPINEEFMRLNYFNDDRLTSREKKRMLQSRFYNELGYVPNIDNPQTLNEKIQWLKLYYNDPLITIGCDKYKDKRIYRKNYRGRICR